MSFLAAKAEAGSFQEDLVGRTEYNSTIVVAKLRQSLIAAPKGRGNPSKRTTIKHTDTRNPKQHNARLEETWRVFRVDDAQLNCIVPEERFGLRGGMAEDAVTVLADGLVVQEEDSLACPV